MFYFLEINHWIKKTFDLISDKHSKKMFVLLVLLSQYWLAVRRKCVLQRLSMLVLWSYARVAAVLASLYPYNCAHVFFCFSKYYFKGNFLYRKKKANMSSPGLHKHWEREAWNTARLTIILLGISRGLIQGFSEKVLFEKRTAIYDKSQFMENVRYFLLTFPNIIF